MSKAHCYLYAALTYIHSYRFVFSMHAQIVTHIYELHQFRFIQSICRYCSCFSMCTHVRPATLCKCVCWQLMHVCANVQLKILAIDALKCSWDSRLTQLWYNSFFSRFSERAKGKGKSAREKWNNTSHSIHWMEHAKHGQCMRCNRRDAHFNWLWKSMPANVDWRRYARVEMDFMPTNIAMTCKIEWKKPKFMPCNIIYV